MTGFVLMAADMSKGDLLSNRSGASLVAYRIDKNTFVWAVLMVSIIAGAVLNHRFARSKLRQHARAATHP